MKRQSPLPPALAAGPFTSRQALDAGVSPKRLRGADIAHPFRGVHVATLEDLTFLERCAALLSKLPDHAFVSHISAAVVMRVPLPLRLEQSLIVHISVPAPRTAPVGRGIVGHTIIPNQHRPRLWRGVLICSPEELWCDLAEHLSLPDLVAAGDFLIHWRLPATTIDALTAAVATRVGRRGAARMRTALALLSDRSESPQESRLRVILVLAGITGFVVNHPITTSGGFQYRADIAFPEARFLLEYQGDDHRTMAAFRADMTRTSRLQADGWFVMQLNANDLDDPVELAQRIRRVLASR